VLSKDAKNANHWWEDEYKRAIQAKNEARGKCLTGKTRTSFDIYHKKEQKLIESVEERKKKG